MLDTRSCSNNTKIGEISELERFICTCCCEERKRKSYPVDDQQAAYQWGPFEFIGPQGLKI